ncbi:hypothetical protein AGOR_G00167270 [Albula goreensis]|uniref:Glycosyl hydrolase family 31 C-terminal domain-containing protein n=1 Tax=Albula goreensis TaxID=1534307 RepID=A0A8T3D1K5_9TELE|nr:hypothetical protein AGOR_G00167270 [Albula goreensis]
MANVSWYGGASVQAQTWPINNTTVSMQPFVVSDLRENPLGYGSVLERYFLGSTGVAVLVDPEVALHVAFDSMQRFCLRTPPSMEHFPLKYTVCVGPNLRTVHQEVWHPLPSHKPVLPKMDILWLPFWKLLVNVDSGVKLEKELRTFSNRLKRHHLGEGVISLTEHSTSLLSNTLDHEYLYSKKKELERPTRDLSLVRLLNVSITMSPFLGVDSQQFQTFLQDGTEVYWLSLPTTPQGHLTPLLTQWKTKFSVKLNVSNPAAVTWFMDWVGGLQSWLDVEYVVLEGGERNPFDEHALRPPKALAGDKYIQLLAGMATRIGDSVIMTAGTRSSHMPLFISMAPLNSDWSYSGLKGLIPAILHYSLLGYSFFIPDAVGGSLSNEHVTDEELFIRWLEIVSFLPVISFQTPPWVCGEDRLLNLTRLYIAKHQSFVIPLILRYAVEWKTNWSPIYRPLWWVSPNDINTFTIDDEFLIGDAVLVAPVTEKGATQRDIYLPDSGFKWQDLNNAQVFDGGTFLRDYPVGLEEVAVFTRKNS